MSPSGNSLQSINETRANLEIKFGYLAGPFGSLIQNTLPLPAYSLKPNPNRPPVHISPFFQRKSTLTRYYNNPCSRYC